MFGYHFGVYVNFFFLKKKIYDYIKNKFYIQRKEILTQGNYREDLNEFKPHVYIVDDKPRNYNNKNYRNVD